MPHVDVLLTDAQARFLGKRAEAIHSTPSAILQALISRVLSDEIASNVRQEGASVQEGFRAHADQHAAVAESLGQSEPDLRLGASLESPAVEGVHSSGDTPGDGPPEPSEPVDLPDEDMHQAFAEFERDYRDISKHLFGDDAAFSAHLPNRHFYAYAVTIPTATESERKSVTLAELLDRLPPSEHTEQAVSMFIAHLVAAPDDPLDGPAIIYPQTRQGIHGLSADA